MYGAAIEVAGRADLGQENGLEVLGPILANGDRGGGARQSNLGTTMEQLAHVRRAWVRVRMAQRGKY